MVNVLHTGMYEKRRECAAVEGQMKVLGGWKWLDWITLKGTVMGRHSV